MIDKSKKKSAYEDRIVARVDKSLSNILTQHKCAVKVGELLAAVIILTCLIGQATKSKLKGLLQVSGHGLIKLISADYFFQSEQLSTKFKIAVSHIKGSDQELKWKAGGIMIRHVPSSLSHSPSEENLYPVPSENESGRGRITILELLESWSRAKLLINTTEGSELIGFKVTSEKLLIRLLNQENLFLMVQQKLVVGCSYMEKKVRDVLSVYSKEDIQVVLSRNGLVTADCQYCGRKYQFKTEILGKN